jgi:tetratricopeptide (TPR) repeat protein
MSYLTAAKLAIYENKPDLSREMNLKALAALTGTMPADHPLFAIIESNLGEIDRNTDKCKDAIPHFERAIHLYEVNGHDPKAHAQQLTNLGVCYFEAGRLDDAKKTLDQSIGEIETNHYDRRWLSEPKAQLADMEYAAGHKAEAIRIETEALAAIEGLPGEDITAMRQYETEQLATFRK